MKNEVGRNIESINKSVKNIECWIALSVFNSDNCTQRNAYIIGKDRLSYSFYFTGFLNNRAHAFHIIVHFVPPSYSVADKRHLHNELMRPIDMQDISQ